MAFASLAGMPLAAPRGAGATFQPASRPPLVAIARPSARRGLAVPRAEPTLRRDPFAFDAELPAERTSAERTPAAAAPAVVPLPPNRGATESLASAPRALRAVITGVRSYALVESSGRQTVVTVGDLIEDRRVIRISRESVTLSDGGELRLGEP